MFNDIWSLGIILLNLATGRNPWKSATPGDPTFQAYLRDPMNFLPSVLPISVEVNEILVRMLDVDWRERMTLREVRYAIEEVTNFYSEGVVFEGSMARCPWEAGMEIDSGSSASNAEDVGPQSPPAHSTSSGFRQGVVDPHAHLHSYWSKDSNPGIISAGQSLVAGSSYGAQWTKRSSCVATWGALETPGISLDSDRGQFHMDLYNSTQSSGLTRSPSSSLPTTPNSLDASFLPSISNANPRFGGMGLMINTNIPRPRIYDYDAADNGLVASYSTHTSLMHTAIEYDPYSSMFYLNSPILRSPEKDKSPIVMPNSAITAVGEDKDMFSPSFWTSSSVTEMSSPSSYANSSSSLSTHAEALQFCRSASPSPEPAESHASRAMFPTLHETQVQYPSKTCQPSFSLSASMTDIVLPCSRLSSTPFEGGKACDTIVTTPFLTNPSTPITDKSSSKTKTCLTLKSFCWTPPSYPSQGPSIPKTTSRHSGAAVFPPCTAPACRQEAIKAVEQTPWYAAQVEMASGHRSHEGDPKTSLAIPEEFDSFRHYQQHQHQQIEKLQPSQLRSPKQWFMYGRLRTSMGFNRLR